MEGGDVIWIVLLLSLLIISQTIYAKHFLHTFCTPVYPNQYRYTDDDTLLAINDAIAKVNSAALPNIQASISDTVFPIFAWGMT